MKDKNLKYQRPDIGKPQSVSKVDSATSKSDDKQDRARARRQWKRLQEKNGFFIFFLGKSGSSKTTILACLTKHIHDNYKVIQNKTKESTDNIAYIRKLMDYLSKNQFPELTEFYKIIDYDITVKFPTSSNNDELNIVFIELSGEDIRKFAYNEDATFLVEMETFFELKKDKVLFFSVLPFNNDESSFDMMHLGFLSRIKGSCQKMSIIASKWDLLRVNEPDNKVTPLNFVQKNYPNVIAQTKDIEHCKVFPFSVGEVKKGKGTNKLEISKLILDDCHDITNWIFDMLIVQPKLPSLEVTKNEIFKEISELQELLRFSKKDAPSKNEVKAINDQIAEINAGIRSLEDSLDSILAQLQNKD